MKKLYSIAVSLILIIAIFTPCSAAVVVTLFDGTFMRDTAAPVVASKMFRAVSGLATVNLTNTGISSASIRINGVEVFGPSEFNQKVGNLEKKVTLNEGDNNLTVLLKSRPGGKVRIQIHMPVEVMLAPNAKVLDDNTMNNLSSISEDRMTLFFSTNTPYIDSLQTGDVIICGVTAATPRGMLRMVVSIEKRGDGAIEVSTGPAALTDAFQELHLKGNIPSAGTAPLFLQQEFMPSPMAAGTVSMPPISYKSPSTNLKVSGSYESTLSADYSFNPDLDYEIDISWFTLKKFKLVLMGSQALALNEQLEVIASGGWSPEVALLPTPMFIATLPIGPVLFTFEFIPSIGFAASFEGAADLSFGFTASNNLTVGFEYDYSSDTWSGIGSCDYSFDPYYSLAGESTFSIKPYFRAKVGFYGYDTVGGYFDLRPYGKWSFTYFPEVYGEFGLGINGNVGIELKWLTSTIGSINLEIFDYYWPFPNITSPVISGKVTIDGSVGVPGVTMNLSGTGGAIDVTDVNGNYSFIVDQNDTYIITPMLAGYTFDPPTKTAKVFDANVIDQDFIASAPLPPPPAAVWVWGDGWEGQLGIGENNTPRSTPVQVSGLSNLVAISAGGYHNLALKSDKTVLAWGANFYGEIGDGTTTKRWTPVQVNGLSNVVAISAGGSYSLALKADGTIWEWGVKWQITDFNTNPIQVSELNNMVAISAGNGFRLALKSDGTVWAWGVNGSGQLGDGTTTTRWTPAQVNGLSNVVAVSAGYDYGIVWGAEFSAALKADGTVWTWGWNSYGQLGDGTTIPRWTPVQVNGLNNVVAISASLGHILAVKSDGTAWGWGLNWDWQLGDGTHTDRWAPVQVSGLNNVAAISAGYYHSLALTAPGP